MSRLMRVLLWIDRAVNVLIGGSFNETLSARAHRMDVKNHPYWGWTAGFIDMLFFWQEDHCRRQWEYERTHPLQGSAFTWPATLQSLSVAAVAIIIARYLS